MKKFIAIIVLFSFSIVLIQSVKADQPFSNDWSKIEYGKNVSYKFKGTGEYITYVTIKAEFKSEIAKNRSIMWVRSMTDPHFSISGHIVHEMGPFKTYKITGHPGATYPTFLHNNKYYRLVFQRFGEDFEVGVPLSKKEIKIFGSVIDVHPGYFLGPQYTRFATHANAHSSTQISDPYFSFSRELPKRSFFWNHPKEPTSTLAIFDAFEINFSGLSVGNPYIFQVRYGRNRSIVSDPTNKANFGWDNWSQTTSRSTRIPTHRGIIRIPSSFRDMHPVTLGTTYYARGYLFSGFDLNTMVLVESTPTISFIFNNNVPLENFPTDQPQIIPHSFLEKEGAVNFALENALAQKFPFAYLYDIRDIINNFNRSAGGNFPELNLSFTDSLFSFEVLAVSPDTLTNLAGNNNLQLMRTLISAMLWALALFVVYSRLKTFLNKS